MKNKYIYALIIFVTSCISVSCTHQMGEAYDNTPAGNVEAAWKILDEKYCLFEDKNINWDSIKTATLDSAEKIDTKDKLALFDLLEKMVNNLNDGHVNIYTSFDVSQCTSWYEGYPTNFDKDIINKYYLQGSRKAGGLQYNKIKGDSIAYVYCSSFESSVSAANMYYVITNLKGCRGMILDVRNNGGGDLEYAYKLASTFIKQDTLIGYSQHKNGPGHNEFSAKKEIWLSKDLMPSKWYKPVIVLQNRHTYSAANSFTNAMRYAYNSAIIGGKSGGGGGMPLSYELPNGWLIRFSSVKMYNAENESLEDGVKPDMEVTQVSKDKDDLIEKAAEIINRAYDKK